MIDNPCYGCMERHVNCHSTCLKGRIWKQEQENKKEVLRKYRKKHRVKGMGYFYSTANKIGILTNVE